MRLTLGCRIQRAKGFKEESKSSCRQAQRYSELFGRQQAGSKETWHLNKEQFLKWKEVFRWREQQLRRHSPMSQPVLTE